MGIAIVHHLDSLREARKLAHRAEQQAKQVGGKNALAIIVSKRGGEDYEAVGKWGNIDVRLSQLIDYYRAASIPVGMAYELRDLDLRLSVPTTDPQYETLQEVIRLDTLRILLRKLTVPAGKLSPEKIEKIETFLRGQLDLPPKEQKDNQNTAQVALLEKKDAPVSLDLFINELVIAQMLAEAQELADSRQRRKGMTLWLVEPHDPLIAREGRPFGPDAGASATTLPFPFPSTLAGGVRSRSAIDENGIFQYERDDQMSPEALRVRQEHLEELKEIRIRGPLLVQLPNESNDLAPDDDAWLVPMPNDAQLVEG